jgi:outer membrane receptor protein involved in Fe transport
MQQVWSRRVLGVALALFALAFVPRAAEAQTGKISGTVTDAATGQPLEGVTVFLQGTGAGALTNASGRYFILSVPPGTYTVVARRIGYQTVERQGVQVLIDVTREVPFSMNASTVLAAQIIRAEATPLIEPNKTGSSIPITAEQISVLPVTSIEGALSLQQGFLAAPNSTDLISFAESRQNAQNPIYVRGGRGGETLLLIDGIPVQNFIYGGPALSLSPMAVQQLDFVKGGAGPEYGNALSGVINIATKEGGSNLAGELKYQTSALGGLANEASSLRDYNLVEGFVSGPVPGLGERLRFVAAARQERQADGVYEFDRDVFSSQIPGTSPSPGGGPNMLDVFPGWRAFGFNNTRQALGKLSYLFTPSSKISLTFLDNQKQRMPFDPQYLLTYGDPLANARNNNDSVLFVTNAAGFRVPPLGFERVVENTINSRQQLYAAQFRQTFSRTTLNVAAGTFQTRRTTCNYFQGVCLETAFADPNFTDDQFIAPLASTCASGPTCGTDTYYGGERLNTRVLRADVGNQTTDHHYLQAGFLYQGYDFRVRLTSNVGTNAVNTYTQSYANKPYDIGTYIQDKIEYDFITVKLGARFDYGKVPGKFFADPLDPTNGTTALDVCNNPNDPRWANGRTFRYVDQDGAVRDTLILPEQDWAPSGAGLTNNCSTADYQVAGRIAAYDDFTDAKARKQFSPRIGVSFPLTQSSSVFFNFGRFSQNPLLNNLLTNTGIGTAAEGTTVGPILDVPGEGGSGIIGNPNLKIETSTTYEVGYNTEFGGNYAFGATLFNKNQTGLTGLRTGGVRLGDFGYEQLFDPGVTYNASNQPSYTILMNQDFQSVRGAEMQLRRRVSNYWGFDVNYSYSRARTNASPPEREFERQANQGDPNELFEVPSDIDQAHVFNTQLTFQVGEDSPGFRFGNLLRNTTVTTTMQYASGLPYTPTIGFTGFTPGITQLARNSARAPATSQVNLLARKGLAIANVRYEIYAQINNLFDRKNCAQVFSTTGRCDTGAPDQDRSRQGNTLQPEAATTTYFDRPYYQAERRTVSGGLRLVF